MRRALPLLAILLACPVARADEKERPASNGVVLGARAAYAFGVGTPYAAFASSNPSFYAGMAPVFVDAGYRFGRLYVGAWFQYGVVVPGSGCPIGFQCTADDIRLGFAADYHVLRRSDWDPWLGVGFGYEWTSLHGDGPATLDASLRGFELFDLEAGLDFDVGHTPLRLGPFIMSSFAQFTDFSRTENGMTAQGRVSTDLGQTEPHGWFVLGVRGRLDL